MSQADVAVTLGSPNIVTTDSEKKETWIYDKIATEASYSTSKGGCGIGAAVLVPSILLGIGGGADYSKSTGASSSTQKTLTVLIKFDNNKNVESFSYHSSKF